MLESRVAIGRLSAIAITAVIITGVLGYQVAASGLGSSPHTSQDSSLVEMPGMTLPLLHSATLLGPADSHQETEIMFILKDSTNGTARSIILNWEQANGVTPGVVVCSGASIHVFPNGTTVTKTCTYHTEQMESNVTLGQLTALLHVNFDTYLYNGQTFFANDANPRVPADVAAALLDITGLYNYSAIIRY